MIVIQPGLFTTVQDEGRWGYQAFGMPVAGVMDRYAYNIVNLLAGNRPSAAVLEMTLQGGHFRFTEDTYFALGGADLQAMLNGIPVQNWSCSFAAAGSELVCGYAATGCRAYLAVRGGLDTQPVLGSRSTYTRAAVGGLEGRALKVGDKLPVGAEFMYEGHSCVLPGRFVPVYKEETEVRVLPGPQEDYFTVDGRKKFFASVYTITTDSDRMGCRLAGEAVAHRGKAEIISDALCQGAVQVPGHGQPIVLLADRQTTGGYPKLGAVIGPDLSLLAQAKPGDKIRFKQCDDLAAVAALQAEEETYRQISAALALTPFKTAGISGGGCTEKLNKEKTDSVSQDVNTAIGEETAVLHQQGQPRAWRLQVNGIFYNVTISEVK